MRRDVLLIYFVMLLATVSGWSGDVSGKETAGQFIDDTLITAKIKALLLSDPTLKPGEIKVETYKGEVQLSGFVSSQRDIDHAAAVAASTAGVRLIRNDLALKD